MFECGIISSLRIHHDEISCPSAGPCIMGFVADIGVLVVLIHNILVFTLFTVHVVFTYFLFTYLLASLSLSRSNVFIFFSMFMFVLTQ